MDNKVVLSICIPTYNRRDCVYECVTKILDNYQLDDIEVVVSDNCSIDGTGEKLSEIRDKRFRYYRNDTNIKWINLLKVMSYSTGQFSMLISDEEDVKIELLQELVRFLLAKPNLALVKSDVFDPITGRGKMCYKRSIASYYDRIMAVNTWAYMSGIIYNNCFILPVLNKMDFADYKRYQKIIGEYPHIWLALAICYRGVEFYPKFLVVHMREGKFDQVLDEDKTKEFVWSIDRRFKQQVAICKSFKWLHTSELSSKEKIGLYCERIRIMVTTSGLGYYKTLYGKDYESFLRKHHPEDLEALFYWRIKNYSIKKNIYLSYKIANLFLTKSLWKNRRDFIKDSVRNWLMIARLYYGSVTEYFSIRKYLRDNCNMKGLGDQNAEM